MQDLRFPLWWVWRLLSFAMWHSHCPNWYEHTGVSYFDARFNFYPENGRNNGTCQMPDNTSEDNNLQTLNRLPQQKRLYKMGWSPKFEPRTDKGNVFSIWHSTKISASRLYSVGCSDVCWTGKNPEWIDHDLIVVLSEHGPERLRKTTKYSIQDGRCLGRDSNQASPIYKSRKLPVGHLIRLKRIMFRV
jgi:hypothetical protein